MEGGTLSKLAINFAPYHQYCDDYSHLFLYLEFLIYGHAARWAEVGWNYAGNSQWFLRYLWNRKSDN